MSKIEPIPEHLQALITTVTNNHESMGGEQRGALAAIQVHSILATNRATEAYEMASKDLRVATNGIKWMTALLAFATLALVFVTACAK